ncbi:unnamed protein product [Chrysodeixis includens]|uniref:Uncharacterized protein n=1 Tax=Chrysodeixis includens TaxID=689277 RepID=A0A9N8L096_CHRIL|nr:unnamed protein product [Chrysodeixis includens]
MKTSSLIQFAALAVALFATVNASGCASAYSQRGMDWGSIVGMLNCEKILCIMNVVSSGDITMMAIMKCMAGARRTAVPMAFYSLDMSDTYATFTIKNADNLDEAGKIMNSALNSGQWVHDDKDVHTVNNIEFDQLTPVVFSASSSDESNKKGTKGSFEIYEAGKGVAEVSFNIPFSGHNKLSIKPLNKHYVCKATGWQEVGSPEVSIICYKIASS